VQQDDERQELRKPDEAEAQRASRRVIDVPARGDVEHLRGKGAEAAGEQEEKKGSRPGRSAGHGAFLARPAWARQEDFFQGRQKKLAALRAVSPDASRRIDGLSKISPSNRDLGAFHGVEANDMRAHGARQRPDEARMQAAGERHRAGIFVFYINYDI